MKYAARRPEAAFVLALTIGLAIGPMACFEPIDEDEEEASELNGKWEGTWARADVMGTLTMTLVQDGTMLIGTGAFHDSPCVASGDIDAKIVDGEFVGDMIVDGGRVLFSGVRKGSELSGTFDLAFENQCNGLMGEFEVTKVMR